MPDEEEVVEEQEQETVPIPPRRKKRGGGARARIEVEGEAPPGMVEHVLQAGTQKHGKGNGTEEVSSQKFEKAIRDLQNRIVARRVAPASTEDGTMLGDEYEINPEPTLTEQAIKTDIAEARGGRRWYVCIYDQNENRVAAKTITVPGEPKLSPEMETFGLSMRRGESPMDPLSPPVEEDVETMLQRDKDIIAQKKRIELLKLKQQQLELEAGSNGGAAADDDEQRLRRMLDEQTAPLRQQNEILQRQLAEKEADAKLQRSVEAAVAPMRAALDKLTATPQTTTSDLKSMLENMELRMKQDTKDRIDATLAAIKSELSGKIDGLTTLVNSNLSHRGNDPATQALISLATKPGPGGSDSDPLRTVERAMGIVKTAREMTGMEGPMGPVDLPTMIVEKLSEVVPQVMDFYKKEGTVQKEQVEGKIKELGNQMYQALDQTIRNEIRAAAAQQGKPVFVPPAGAPAPAPPAPAATPPPPAAPAQPNPFDVGEAKKKRVNGVLKMLLHEIQIGAKVMSWPEKANEWLPKDILDTVVQANDDAALYNAIKPWGDPALLEQIWSYLRETNPQHEWYRGWVSNGINWLKEEAVGVEEEGGGTEGEGVTP